MFFGIKNRPSRKLSESAAISDATEYLHKHLTVICNPYYSSFYTNQRKDAETVANLLADLEATPQIAELASQALTLDEYIEILLADDAKQFHHQTLIRALCWIHEERHYKKLNPYFQAHQKLVEEFRQELWDYYSELKA